MHDYRRKYKAIIGLLFIVCQIVLYLNIDSIEKIEAITENKFIQSLVFNVFIFGIGPLMSIEMITHYNWGIDLEMIVMLGVSWFPAILLYLGFFVIKTKNYIFPLLLGLVMWPCVSFFWVAMGA